MPRPKKQGVQAVPKKMLLASIKRDIKKIVKGRSLSDR